MADSSALISLRPSSTTWRSLATSVSATSALPSAWDAASSLRRSLSSSLDLSSSPSLLAACPSAASPLATSSSDAVLLHSASRDLTLLSKPSLSDRKASILATRSSASSLALSRSFWAFASDLSLEVEEDARRDSRSSHLSESWPHSTSREALAALSSFTSFLPCSLSSWASLSATSLAWSWALAEALA